MTFGDKNRSLTPRARRGDGGGERGARAPEPPADPRPRWDRDDRTGAREAAVLHLPPGLQPSAEVGLGPGRVDDAVLLVDVQVRQSQWQGHLNLFSAAFHGTTHPRCVQIEFTPKFSTLA